MKSGWSKDGSFGTRRPCLEQILVLQITPVSQVSVAASVSQPYVARSPLVMRSKVAELRETARDQLQWTNDAVQGEDGFLGTSKVHHEVTWSDACFRCILIEWDLLGPSNGPIQQDFQEKVDLCGLVWFNIPMIAPSTALRYPCHVLEGLNMQSQNTTARPATRAGAQKRWVVASKTMLFFAKPKKLDLGWCELWVYEVYHENPWKSMRHVVLWNQVLLEGFRFV